MSCSKPFARAVWRNISLSSGQYFLRFIHYRFLISLPHGIAQGVALVLDCGWIKGLGRLFLQLLHTGFTNKHLLPTPLLGLFSAAAPIGFTNKHLIPLSAS